jgi:hypothetical protein
VGPSTPSPCRPWSRAEGRTNRESNTLTGQSAVLTDVRRKRTRKNTQRESAIGPALRAYQPAPSIDCVRKTNKKKRLPPTLSGTSTRPLRCSMVFAATSGECPYTDRGDTWGRRARFERYRALKGPVIHFVCVCVRWVLHLASITHPLGHLSALSTDSQPPPSSSSPSFSPHMRTTRFKINWRFGRLV